MRSTISRRGFLGGVAASVVLPRIVPASALGRDGNLPPSERITIAMFGVGNRGTSSLQAMRPLPDHQVLAIADCRRDRAELAQRNVHSFYAERVGQQHYAGCEIYNDFREVLERDDIDVIWGCVPDHWHGVVYSRAIEAGKDLYGEKPVTRWIDQGIRIRDMVRQYGCVFQTGTQQRSSTHFRHACELARNGYLGKVHTVYVGCPGGRTYPVEPPSDPPAGFDYDFWSGPAPLIPFDTKRCEWLAMYMISHYCAGLHHQLGRASSGHRRLGLPRGVPGTVRNPGHGRVAARRDDGHLDLLADGPGVGQRPEDEIHQYRQSEPAGLQVRGRCRLGPREPQRHLGRAGFAADRQAEARRIASARQSRALEPVHGAHGGLSSAASAPGKIRFRPSRTDMPPAPWATWPTSRCVWTGDCDGIRGRTASSATTTRTRCSAARREAPGPCKSGERWAPPVSLECVSFSVAGAGREFPETVLQRGREPTVSHIRRAVGVPFQRNRKRRDFPLMPAKHPQQKQGIDFMTSATRKPFAVLLEGIDP
jgi:hypothetical protein